MESFQHLLSQCVTVAQQICVSPDPPTPPPNNLSYAVNRQVPQSFPTVLWPPSLTHCLIMEDNKLADFEGVKMLESHSVHMDYTKK